MGIKKSLGVLGLSGLIVATGFTGTARADKLVMEAIEPEIQAKLSLDKKGDFLNKDEYINRELGFKLRIAPVWKEKLSYEDLGHRVDFYYNPLNKKDKRAKLFTISLNTSGEESELGRLKLTMGENPYKKGSEDHKSYKLYRDVLDGINDLYSPIDRDFEDGGILLGGNYISQELGIKMKVAPVWEKGVSYEKVEDGIQFYYLPIDKNLKSKELFKLRYRLEGEESDFKFIVLESYENPYEKTSEDYNRYKIFRNVLDGVTDLVSEDIKPVEYVNEGYGFKLRISPLWQERVKDVEGDHDDVRFLYLPKDEKLGSGELLKITSRDLNYKVEEGKELELGRGKYKYVMSLESKNPYEKDSEDYKGYQELSRVLDGVQDLFSVIEEEELNLNKISVSGELIDLKMYEDGEVLMLPVAKVLRQMGYDVTWTQKTKLVRIFKDKMEVAGIKTGTRENYHLKSLVNLDHESIVKEGVTYVPLEFFNRVMALDYSQDGEILNIY